MDLAQILIELWRRRVWMAVGVAVALIAGLATAYNLSILPPGLSKKGLSIGTAQTQLFIDTPKSTLGDLRFGAGTFKSLSERAAVYASLMTSDPVRNVIAEELEVDPERLVLQGPSAGQTRAEREPDAQERAEELLEEGAPFVLSFSVTPGSPSIRVLAQAVDGDEAIRAADAAGRGFRRFIGRLGREQGVPASARATVRQLGRATGGTVADGVELKLAALAFVGALLLWALLVLIASNVVDTVHRLRAAGVDRVPRD